MKRKLNTGKRVVSVLKFFVLLLFVAFLGFELRGLFPFDPIVPFEWSGKISEFILIHTPFEMPFAPTQTCPEYKKVIGMMNSSFPNHSVGQSEFYGYTPMNPSEQVEPVIDRGVSYYEAGIVKWRYADTEPYIAFELAGNWTNRYYNESGKGMSVQQIEKALPSFIDSMEKIGFTFSKPNNIPLYTYPEGFMARKFGFTKGEYMYHFTVVEDEIPYDPSISKDSLPPDFQKPVQIAMNCAENSTELRNMYEAYLSLPHEFTGETSVVYSGRKDNLAKFSIYFPGGVIDQVQDEYYDLREYPMKLVSQNNNFSICSLYERMKIGKAFPCYRPEIKEFSVVTY